MLYLQSTRHAVISPLLGPTHHTGTSSSPESTMRICKSAGRGKVSRELGDCICGIESRPFRSYALSFLGAKSPQRELSFRGTFAPVELSFLGRVRGKLRGASLRGGKVRGTVRGFTARWWVMCKAGMCDAQQTAQ